MLILMPNMTAAQVHDAYLTAVLTAIHHGDAQSAYIYARMSATLALALDKAEV